MRNYFLFFLIFGREFFFLPQEHHRFPEDMPVVLLIRGNKLIDIHAAGILTGIEDCLMISCFLLYVRDIVNSCVKVFKLQSVA